MLSEKVDVLVSGAGPVGLYFTYQLALRGHTVCCVDPKPGPTEQSRAILITSRTMEILENKGLAGDILVDAVTMAGIRMWNNGNIVAQVDACGDTPFPHFTALMQGKTEQILVNRIEKETSARIHWGVELVSYDQNEHGVKSVVRDIHTRQERTIESAYIVGADGTHSAVRKGQADWKYEGVAISTRFGLADLYIYGENMDRFTDKGNNFMKGHKMLGMVRLNPMNSTGKDKHAFRIFGNLESYKYDKDVDKISHGFQSQEEPLTLEFLQKWVDEMAAPFKFELKDLIWSSNFRINERMANGFRRGRAFLIGDSAHCHSPVGGQGMNMGLHDADNLVWKLSYVLKNLASDPEKLLDSYNAEREPRVKATIQATSVSTETAISTHPLMVTARFALMSMLFKIPQVRSRIFKTVMQQDITIDPKIKGSILGVSEKSLIQPGEFLHDTDNFRRVLIFPDESTQRMTIERKTLRQIMIGYQNFTVIYVGTCLSSSKPNRGLLEKFWQATGKYSHYIHRLVIQSPWYSHASNSLPDFVSEDEKLSSQNSFWCEERIDSPVSLTNRVGLYAWLMSYTASVIAPAVVLIVRPDLYVAQAQLVASEDELNAALNFLPTILS